MNRKLETVGRWGAEWHQSSDWSSHTADKSAGIDLAEGILRFLSSTCDWRPDPSRTIGLDIGAGAGHVSVGFARHGILMTASEWDDAGLELLSRESPDIPRRKIDVLEYCEPETWDLIFCRELYPFTRSNSFSGQFEIVSRLIDSLKAGGVLVIVGSNVTYPHCLDQRLLLDELKKDPRLKHVTRRYLEALINFSVTRYLPFQFYWLTLLALSPVIWWKLRFQHWAAHNVFAFQKKQHNK